MWEGDLWNSDAPIADFHTNVRCMLLDGHENWCTRRAVLQGILDEVLENLFQPKLVALDDHRSGRLLQLNHALIERCLNLVHHATSQRTHIHGRAVDRKLARFYARNIEQRKN